MAEAMNCYAEIKYHDPNSGWACYIYAINPEDDDEIACIINDRGDIDVIKWSYAALNAIYNEVGEHPQIDDEYRPMRTAILFKRLCDHHEEKWPRKR